MLLINVLNLSSRFLDIQNSIIIILLISLSTNTMLLLLLLSHFSRARLCATP